MNNDTALIRMHSILEKLIRGQAIRQDSLTYGEVKFLKEEYGDKLHRFKSGPHMYLEVVE